MAALSLAVEPAIEAPVLDGLRQVRRRDGVLAAEIRDGSCHPEDPGVSARGQTEPVTRQLEEALAGRAEPARAPDFPSRSSP